MSDQGSDDTPVPRAKSVLSGYFLCEWFDDWDTLEADNAAQVILNLLRELPVEDRMEAMGMERLHGHWPKHPCKGCITGPWVEKP